MLMWALDKFIRPVHAAGVFGHFYALGALGSVGFVAA
jgi:putative oxidoreductase